MDDFSLGAGDGGDFLHHAGAHRGHLGTEVRNGNGGNGVAPEGRPGHKKLVVEGFLSRDGGDGEITDIQLGAVRRQTGMDAGSHAGSQVTTDGRGAEEHDFRLAFMDNGRDGLGVGLRHIVFQIGMIHHHDLVGAVFGQNIGLIGDFMAQQHGYHFGI